MSKKKVFLSILAVVLLCGITAAGTLAFLKDDTGPLKNTFVKGNNLFSGNGGLTLQEYNVTPNDDGSYTIGSSLLPEGQGIDYTVTPFVNINKKPVVNVTGKTSLPAWLYIEVVDKLPVNVSYKINATNWIDTGKTGPHNGPVYCYKNALVTGNLSNIAILQGNVLTVGDTKSVSFNNQSLTFYAYMVQGSAGSTPADAWVAANFTA